MRLFNIFFLCVFVFFSCGTVKHDIHTNADFTIAFGSCNHQERENLLWPSIISQQPDLWIWGGDIVYSDTDDMNKLRADYQKVNDHPGYANLKSTTPVLATWDDHDYGLNDGGDEFTAKDASQQEFLTFLGLEKDDPRRKRAGVYHSENYTVGDKTIKVIILDTRYFRSSLTPSADPNKRYDPNSGGVGTILGESQWKWLSEELITSKAQFNIIVSSVQFLSGQHGFESWGNFPHEITKMTDLIQSSNAKGVIFLSGDRHISEFSSMNVENINYPIIDFTSSGMTHSYTSFSGEPNKYRVGEVVADKSYGLLELNLNDNTAHMSIIGEGDKVLSTFSQHFSR